MDEPLSPFSARPRAAPPGALASALADATAGRSTASTAKPNGLPPRRSAVLVPAAAPASAIGTLCPVCQSPLAEGEPVITCPGCAALHHGECWQEVGGCGVYGCAKVPPTEKRDDLEVPAGWWGKETKPCPRCGKEIQAMAVRCRHCGAEMSAGAALSGKDWRIQRAEIDGRGPLRRRCLWVFLLCIVPPTAPLAVIPATIWLARRHHTLATIGSLHRALPFIGVALAWLLCAGLVLALIVAKATSTHGS